MSEVTGERLVPGAQHGELVHAEHLARYRLAAGLAEGKRVLDAACGEGYGSALLARAGAATVAGVDIDEPTVQRARERYGLDFQVADIASLPFGDGAFDLVVSFETIEHVPNPEAALAELARVLDPAGLLVISTPNKQESLVPNEFHIREFTHDEFVALLSERFPAVRLVHQHNWTTSALLEDADFREQTGDRALDLTFYKVGEGVPGHELYTVALCGHASAGVAVTQVAVAACTDEAHELARRALESERVALHWHREFDTARETAERWHAEYEKAKRIAERWHDQYQAIARSRTWRFTAPMRRLAGLRRRRR
jgi:SAM-dependent methyltransferase